MTQTLLINSTLALLPVVLFLTALVQSDSFKIVRFGFVMRLIAAGVGTALVASMAGKAFMQHTGTDYTSFVRLGGPFLEETLKSIVIYVLIRANRIGFVLDAVIAGFAVGAGFALLENIFYLEVLGQGQTAVWVIRGFGTAIMHGGATAFFAVIAHLLTPQNQKSRVLHLLPGFAAALMLHSIFNQFLTYPVSSTIVILIGLAASLAAIMHASKQAIHNWIDVDFENYRGLLDEINSGAFRDHQLGRILDTLNIRFDPSEIAEITSYVRLHSELVLFAETLLKTQGSGEAIEIPESVKNQLAQFHYLDERIGRAVRLVLQQNLRVSRKQIFQLYKLERDSGPVMAKAHQFNTDLLLDAADRDAAKREFPDVFFALDNPALREAFAPFDERANMAKKKSKYWGILAVLLATGALILAGGNMLYGELSYTAQRLISAIGGIALISSLIIGGLGLNYRSRKMRWLADRLATERIRQFHFQYYVMHANEILAAIRSPDGIADFCREREKHFAQFINEYIDHVDEQLHKLVHTDDPSDRITFEGAPSPITKDIEHNEQYFDAYARLRFDRQINYCNHVLRESKSIRRPSANRLVQIFSGITFVGIFGILFLQFLVFVGLFVKLEWMHGSHVTVLIIWAAVLVLSTRTFEAGLRPEQEIDRVRQYRLFLRRIHAEFRKATTPEKKIASMLELEKLTYQESVLFLKSNYEAEFIM